MRPLSWLCFTLWDANWHFQNKVLDRSLVYFKCYCEARHQYDSAVTSNEPHTEVTLEFPWAFTHLPLLRWWQLLIHTSGSRCLCDFWLISHTNLGCLQWCISFWQTAGVSEFNLLGNKDLWWCTAETYCQVHLSLFVSFLNKGNLLQLPKESPGFKLML